MWNISRDKIEFYENALLKGEREDILFYDVPILFAGVNSEGKRVIGSFIDIDEEKDSENYLHAIIDEGIYDTFISGVISYPEALRKARQIYVISWFNPQQKPATVPIKFNEIPEEFRPAEIVRSNFRLDAPPPKCEN